MSPPMHFIMNYPLSSHRGLALFDFILFYFTRDIYIIVLYLGFKIKSKGRPIVVLVMRREGFLKIIYVTADAFALLSLSFSPCFFHPLILSSYSYSP